MPRCLTDDQSRLCLEKYVLFPVTIIVVDSPETNGCDYCSGCKSVQSSDIKQRKSGGIMIMDNSMFLNVFGGITIYNIVFQID